MNLADSPQEAEFRRAATEWLQGNAEPRTVAAPPALFDERESEGFVEQAKQWQAKKFDAGWATLTWPSAYGGRDARPIEQAIWDQEEAKYQTPPNIFAVGVGMVGPTIIAHGTSEQRERYVGPLGRGDEVWCQLFSEPGAGSDLAGVATRAVPDGGVWRVDGQKVWTSRAHQSQFGLLLARSDADVPKHRGLTAFLVDMKAPGVAVRPIRQITGESKFNEVFFDSVVVNDDHRLGAVGDGWRVALTTLMNERLYVGAQGDTDVAFLLEQYIDLARRCRLSGDPAIEHGAIRQRIVEATVLARGLTFTSYRTLTALARDAEVGAEGSIGKLLAAPFVQAIARNALDLLADGVVEPGSQGELDWHTIYLKASGMRIAGGTDEIQRNILAERILGLPAEPRLDKALPFREVTRG